MEKLLKWILLICLVLSFSFSSFAENKIRIAVGEWVPFTSKDLKYYGLFSRIVSEAFALEDIKVEYGWFPWKRALTLIEFGEWDSSPGWSRKPEREKYAYFSDPLYESKAVFFHLKSFPFDWNSYDDLKGITIGATIGYMYGKNFEQAEKDGKLLVERVPTDEQNFRKLLKGRIKLFPASLETGIGTLNKNFSSTQVKLVTYHEKPYRQKAVYHLIFSKKIDRNKKMLKLFNKGLRCLKNSGKYDQYIEESQRGYYIIKK